MSDPKRTEGHKHALNRMSPKSGQLWERAPRAALAARGEADPETHDGREPD